MKEPIKLYYTTSEIAGVMNASYHTAVKYLKKAGVKSHGSGKHLRFRVEQAYAAVRLYFEARAEYQWSSTKMRFNFPKVMSGLGY